MIFQKIYDWIRGWQPPQWVKDLLGQLSNLIISIATQVGQAYIDFLKQEIIFASTQSWTPKEKFDYVFKKAKSGFVQFGVSLKDNEINTIINFLVSQLKRNNTI